MSESGTGSLGAAAVLEPGPPPDKIIFPGSSIQPAVDASPPGTSFLIKAGVYRLQEVVPKDGDTFSGEEGTVLNGARLVTDFSQTGSLWMAKGQKQQSTPHGKCMASAPRCNYAEDVYFDEVPLLAVASAADVRPGTFYFDYDADQIFLGDDPSGHKVEAAVSKAAFSGVARDVTIRGLVVEKYANPAQTGAIQARYGWNWRIEGNTARWNHGAGILAGPASKVLRNSADHNGQLGISGVGAGLLIEDNEISYNNTRGYDHYWEAGGSKFVLTEDLVVRGNRVHHNHGPGLWTDIDNIRTTYEKNLVYDNDYVGIFHEISYDGLIRNNISAHNGMDMDTWLWGSQILLSTSQNVEVSGNVLYVAAGFGNGFGIIQQKRGSGTRGAYRAVNNQIHDNVIVYEGKAGMSGAVADDNEAGMLTGNNLLRQNTYVMQSGPGVARWFWGGEADLSSLNSKGQEVNSVLQTQWRKFIVP